MDTAEYIKLLIALLAIIDIPGSIPMFLQQTAPLSGRERLVTSATAAIATAAILLFFAALGDAVLASFGISLAAFKVMGGLVVLLIALQLLGLTGQEHGGTARDSDPTNPVVLGIFPLAIPLFAGPGSITAVMVYASTGQGTTDHSHLAVLVLVILSASTILGISLALAGMLSRIIGPTTQVVMNRLLGMIVGALGIEFILDGLAQYFPTLAGS